MREGGAASATDTAGLACLDVRGRGASRRGNSAPSGERAWMARGRRLPGRRTNGGPATAATTERTVSERARALFERTGSDAL